MKAAAVETIRPFTERDIPQVTSLHRKVFEPRVGAVPGSDEQYEHYFHDVFLANPRRVAGLESLVAESHGIVVGFLGVMPQRIRVGSTTLLAAICTQFCVDPEHRGLTGPKMLCRHFAGPQDLSFTDEANDSTRRLWVWAGGEALVASSLVWTRPIQPFRFAASLLAGRRVAAGIVALMHPLLALGDQLARMLAPGYWPQPSSGRTSALEVSHIVNMLPHLLACRSGVPDYDDASLLWCLRRAAASSASRGELRQALVHDTDGRAIGWYVYHAPRGETGQVLQVVAGADVAATVLDHLFADAWSRGVLAVSGRVDPTLVRAYASRRCVLTSDGYWTLVHAKDPALSAAFQRGEVFLSRLEGEWCARFS